MSINSMIFLTAFLPVVFVLDRLCVRKTALKNILLLLASLVFYAWGDPVYIVLLLVSIAANYGIGLLLGCQRDESVAAKAVLAAGILVNLGILGYYKYFDFFLRIVNRLTGSEHEMRNIPLPIGISFFTFGAISYLMDLYRGHYEAEKNPLNMALYLSFFPKISVGPIARYRDFAPQLTNRQETVEKTAEGIRRFAYGLGKKVLVANIVGASVDKIYAQDITNVTGVMVWCAAILYAIQIYYDFSGFTDMAIGLGKMFGFDICENFNYPYLSGSIQEFWRRWHITLGAWFKAYIFYPVSVSGLVKKWNQYGRKHCGKHITRLVTSAIALFPVWVANGVWHGAQWNYIFYGMYYFVLIMLGIAVEPVRDCILETCHINPETRVWRTIQIAKTWVIIVVGELFFRANGLKAGWYMFCNMIKHFDAGQLTDGTLYTLGLERADYLAVIVGCLIVGIVGSMKEHGIHVQKKMGELAVPVRWGLYYALIIGILIFAAYGDGYQIQDLIYAGF